MEHIEPIQFKYASREMRNNDIQYTDADQSKSQWNFLGEFGAVEL